jgi:hypothetical protein
MNSDSSDDTLRDTITKALHNEQFRNELPYDGVMGELPHFPESFQHDFKERRNRSLKKYSHDEILVYMEEAERIIQAKREVDPNESGYIRYQIPPDIDQDIFTLVNYKKVDRLYKEEGREAGLALLTDQSHASLMKKGSDYGTHQSRNASKPRGKIETDDGETITIDAIIIRLATKTEFEDWHAFELWEKFLSELVGLCLDPDENTDSSDKRKWSISYDSNNKRKSITFGQFSNVVSKARSSKNSG